MKKQKLVLRKKLFLNKGTIAMLNDGLEAVKGGASGTGWGCQGPSYCEWSKPPECTQPSMPCPVTEHLCPLTLDLCATLPPLC